MTPLSSDRTARLRLLETWLPLVQHENGIHGWGYDAATLEALILVAAPALRQATTPLAARAVLWYYHRQLQEETRR